MHAPLAIALTDPSCSSISHHLFLQASVSSSRSMCQIRGSIKASFKRRVSSGAGGYGGVCPGMGSTRHGRSKPSTSELQVRGQPISEPLRFLKSNKLFLERVIRQQDKTNTCKTPAHFNVVPSDAPTHERPPAADPGVPAERV